MRAARAGDGIRTRECQLGRLMPYHLATFASYYRTGEPSLDNCMTSISIKTPGWLLSERLLDFPHSVSLIRSSSSVP